MKVVFLLGSPDISGGTYVIFEHAIRMLNNGYEVSIVTDENFDKKRLDWHEEAKKLDWLIYDDLKDKNFDIAIATWWKTIFSLAKIKAKKYAYFVQSIESKFYPEYEVALKSLVDSTYTLSLPVITEATWIKDYLEDNYVGNVLLARNGIRKDLYNSKIEAIKPRKDGFLRVLVEGPLKVSFKNVEKTIELCKKSMADEIWLLTSSDISSYEGIDRVFSRVPIHKTAEIYNSCDVIVKLSYVEGMFGPPLEMFHCGGTAIVYDVSGHDEYIEHEKNAFVVGKDKEEDVVKYLNILKTDISLLKKLKNNALDTANSWIDWEESSSGFIKHIEKIYSQTCITKKDIEKLTNFHMNSYIKFEDFLKKDYKLAIIKFMHNIKEIIKYRCPKFFQFIKKFKK